MKRKSKQRVAIYARVSTADQKHDRQVRDLTMLSKRLDYEIVETFIETASGVKDNRPVRKKVLALAQARKIDAILVTEMSRFGRSTIDLVSNLQQLDAWGVSVIAQTGLTFDLSTPHGRLIANFIASLAEFERDLISERVRSGLATARAKGKRLGRLPGDTYKQDRYEKRILRLRQQGKSYRDIAEALDLNKDTVMAVVRRKGE